MSNRQRRTRVRALRQTVNLRKSLRRRARGARTKPTAGMGVAALTLAALASTAPALATGVDGGDSVLGLDAVRRGAGGDADETRLSTAQCGLSRTPTSTPFGLVDLDGTLFFSANDGVHGGALWKSDGTVNGTVLVRDIDPGVGRYGPQSLTAADETLFFVADDGVHGQELWKSDGTRAGTVLVRDSTSTYEGPQNLIAAGGMVFFTNDDGTHGRELWRSDGTRAGTFQLRDINVGGNSRISYQATVGGTLFFNADDGTHGRELWKSDGTRAGTVMVKDIDPTDDDKDYYGPVGMAAVGDTLFFSADEDRHGRELWRSDGTEAGTVMVEDLKPGRGDGSFGGGAELNGRLFFRASDGVHGHELWRSDGTASGTRMLADIRPGRRRSNPSDLTNVGGTLFFNAVDRRHGIELWKSDGTKAGTARVTNMPGDDPYYNYAQRLTDVGGKLFFSIDDGKHGTELWTSDGSASGTVMVEDIDPLDNDPHYDGPFGLTESGGRLFFTAKDGLHGRELWRSNGTAAGTKILDVNRKGVFRITQRTKANKREGTRRVKIAVKGAGRFVVGPAAGSLIKTSSIELPSADRINVVLEPTAEGMKALQRALRKAQREGKNVGRLEVDARFTFTPCGGTPTTTTHRYTLKLKAAAP